MLLWFFRNNTSKSKEGRNSCALDLGAVWGAINEKYQTREPSRIRGFLKGIRCLEHPRAIRGPIECNTTVPVCRIVGTLVSYSSAFRSGRGRPFFPLEREDAQGRERMQASLRSLYADRTDWPSPKGEAEITETPLIVRSLLERTE